MSNDRKCRRIDLNPKLQKEAATLNFTERQAEAILTMQLSKLIGLEILKLHEEEGSLKDSIAEYEKVLGSKRNYTR